MALLAPQTESGPFKFDEGHFQDSVKREVTVQFLLAGLQKTQKSLEFLKLLCFFKN